MHYPHSGVVVVVVVVVFALFLVEDVRSEKSKWDRYESMVKTMQTNSLLEDVWEKDHIPKFKGGSAQNIPEGM